MTTTTQLVLTNLANNQASAAETVNDSLAWIDALMFNAVKDRDLTAPPGGEAEGDRYLPAATATGSWTGKEGQIALYLNGAYYFRAPVQGWQMWIDDENIWVEYDGAAWVARSKSRIQTLASAATVTPNADHDDIVKITALAEATSFANPTPTTLRHEGQRIVLRIKDDATPRALAFGSQYRAMGTALPTTTVASKTLYLTFVFNSTDTTWDLLHSAQQA